MRLPRVLVLVALLAGTALADDTPARLAGYDAIARTGHAVKLRAKLEGKGVLGVYSSVEAEFLDFWLTGEPNKDGKPGVATLEKEKFLGTAKTDSNGIGELEWTPETPYQGSLEVEARVRKGSKYVAVPATLDVLLANHDRPLTLVTIEQTLTDLSWTTFMRKDAKDIPVNEGAAEALNKLWEKHGIVYMTGVEEVSLVKTKDWLKLKGFPRGPVFFWNISASPTASGLKYKSSVAAKLKTDFGGLTSGIGGQVEDANACIANGITAYLVANNDASAPAEAIKVKAWDKLQAAVERQHDVEGFLRDLAGKDAVKQEPASAALAKVETGEIGYLVRFLKSSDVDLAAAARLIVGRIRARDAFAASLDAASDSSALASLIAAWRQGDATVTARLYRDGASGLAKGGPGLEKFRAIEVVNRSEPEPGKVIYRLRFLPREAGAESVEKDYAFLRGDDQNWRVEAGDL
ncbi:MAG TPA: hypothetical protein VFF73_08915 [Planctomycetota bacterium]|nr:hypothetical protein [Planctomycetota bacterium]